MASLEELLEFCGKHSIWADVEVVTASEIQRVWNQLRDKNDGVKYVIDIKKSLESDYVPALIKVQREFQKINW